MKILFFDQRLVDDLHLLEETTSSKVFRTIHLLEEFGAQLRMPHSKKITANLFELRTKGIEEVRILYTYKKNAAILLHVFTKKTQKTPQREINTALKKLKGLD